MSALSPSHVNASHRARRRGLFARAFESLCRGRMAQAERIIREHRHLLSDTHGTRESPLRRSASLRDRRLSSILRLI